MKKLILSVFVLVSQLGSAQTDTEVERINFFPKASDFFRASFQHSLTMIETPQDSVRTKEVHNYANLLGLSYSHRLNRWSFLGVTAQALQISNNGVGYGIPNRERFYGAGFIEPVFFLIYRLRPQKDERGVVDLNVSYSPGFKGRKVGSKYSNPLNSRNILHVGLSHGLWEEQWEFQSSGELRYFSEGDEHNVVSDTNYKLESFFECLFQFKTQYRLDPLWFLQASIGVIYRSNQEILDRAENHRELLAGSGSLLGGGIKRVLNDNSMIELAYRLKRNEYFVKSEATNLEGEESQQDLMLNYIRTF